MESWLKKMAGMESLEGDLSQPSNLWLFRWFLKSVKIKEYLLDTSAGFPKKFGPLASENYKFPVLDEKDIRDRVSRLQNVLGLDVLLECTNLSERTILIRKNDNSTY